MQKILGISAGRKNKVTESLVKAVLEGSGKACSFESLSAKIIRPCEGCNGCIQNNRCVLKDDFQPIMEKCHDADAIVFGAPNYWNRMNAKGASFWERACFSGRHNSVFPLSGKMGVIAAVSGTGDASPVVKDLELFFDDARLHVVGSLQAQGEYACFTCGYGNYCPVGGFVEMYPLGTKITEDIVPSIYNQHPDNRDLEAEKRDVTQRALEMGRILGRVLENKKIKEKAFVNNIH